MEFVYNVSRASYDDPSGPPPGSPPTSTPFYCYLSFPVGLIFILSKVRGPMAVNSDNDLVVYRHRFHSYLLILSDTMASPFCTKN
jgi:hypothetical protein